MNNLFNPAMHMQFGHDDRHHLVHAAEFRRNAIAERQERRDHRRQRRIANRIARDLR